MASRMAARSTTAGTPVKSCISTRAGRNAISRSEVLVLSHCATAWMSSLVTRAAVLVAQQVLQQHLHRERQPGDALQPVLLGGGEAVIGVGLAADLEGLAAAEAVERGHDGRFPSRPDEAVGMRYRRYRSRPRSPVATSARGSDRERGYARAYKVFFCAVPDNRLSSTSMDRKSPGFDAAGAQPLGGRATGSARGRLMRLDGIRPGLHPGRPAGLFRRSSFAVAAGEALLVTGPNGAGKSSLLRLVAGPGAARRRRAVARGRRPGAQHRRTGALSRPSGRPEACADGGGKPRFLERASWAARRSPCDAALGGRRARRHRRPARRLSLGRPAAAALDRPADRGQAPALAARRADLRARHRRPGHAGRR